MLSPPPPSNSLECIAAAEDGELELATTEPEPGRAAAHASESSSGGGSGGAGATPLSAEAANTTAASPSAAGEGVEEQLQRLRIAAREGDGLMEQLAAKYGCSSSGSGGNSADGCARRAAPRCTACAVWQHCGHRLPAQLVWLPHFACQCCHRGVPCRCPTGWLAAHACSWCVTVPPASCRSSGAIAAGGPSPKDDNDDDFVEVAKPGRPLHWFGSLVAPSLRDAEGHFGEGLALAVQAANAQRRLHQAMECHKAAPAAAAAAAAVAVAAEGPVYI